MRIIGGKDYYDSAAAYGIDPGIVFVRKEFRLTNGDMDRIGRFIPQTFIIRPDTDEEDSWKTRSQWSQGNLAPGLKVQATLPIVIFCGKVYSGVFVTIIEGTGDHEVKTEHRFWNAEKFDAFLKERGWRTSSSFQYGEHGYSKLEDKFAAFELKGDALQCLLEKKIVCVTFKETSFVFNRLLYRDRAGWLEQESDYVANSDNLKDWDFQKAFDPVSAFQEISQWVGGTLASYGPDIIEIKDDSIKLAKHGMDKWSFRKKTKNSK
jgi:hypothetical protein